MPTKRKLVLCENKANVYRAGTLTNGKYNIIGLFAVSNEPKEKNILLAISLQIQSFLGLDDKYFNNGT
jgi:hypothetical protein